MTPILPFVGLAGGAALLVVGSSQLSAVWLAPPGAIAPRDRSSIAAVAIGLVGLGTVLEALATYELQRSLVRGRRS